MQWLFLFIPILVGILFIKWLTALGAKQLESNAARKGKSQKKRLEPSARLPEVVTPTFGYQTRVYILSKAEQIFYRTLEQALNQQFLILMKVRVADVLQPEQGLSKSIWQTAFNRISAKHFDFLICDQNSFEIIAAIELDDCSHQRLNRKNRDKFLNAACVRISRYDTY